MRKDLSSRRAIGRSRADRQIYSFRRLPKLHSIPLGIDKPPESPVIVVLRLRIDHRSGCLQFRQHSVQIIDLKIQHGRLRNRKVIRSLRKKRHRDRRPLRLPWKSETPVRDSTAYPQMLFVPRIQSLGISSPQKRTTQSGDFSHKFSQRTERLRRPILYPQRPILSSRCKNIRSVLRSVILNS